jgi:putative oxidoreductase
MAPSTPMQNALALAGRVLIALLFVPEGVRKLIDFGGTVGYITHANVPLPEVAAVIAIIVELGLALLLLAGWQTRWVALAMAIYVIVITPIFHPYWNAAPAQLFSQKVNFFKNLAIIGGLLQVVAFGPGGWSLDAGRGKG